jgi:hypothetical protein
MVLGCLGRIDRLRIFNRKTPSAPLVIPFRKIQSGAKLNFRQVNFNSIHRYLRLPFCISAMVLHYWFSIAVITAMYIIKVTFWRSLGLLLDIRILTIESSILPQSVQINVEKQVPFNGHSAGESGVWADVDRYIIGMLPVCCISGEKMAHHAPLAISSGERLLSVMCLPGLYGGNKGSGDLSRRYNIFILKFSRPQIYPFITTYSLMGCI